MKFLRGLCYVASIIICAYICSFIGMFEITGLPARNESGWLGPTLRFETEPAETDKATIYTNDTKVYSFYKPLASLWLKAQTLPPESELTSPSLGRGGNRPGGDRNGATMSADDNTSGSGEGRERRRRPDGENFSPREGAATSGTINRSERGAATSGTLDRSERGPRQRNRSGGSFTGERRRPQSTDSE